VRKYTLAQVSIFYLIGQRRRAERVVELARAVNMGSKASEKDWKKFVKEQLDG